MKKYQLPFLLLSLAALCACASSAGGRLTDEQPATVTGPAVPPDRTWDVMITTSTSPASGIKPVNPSKDWVVPAADFAPPPTNKRK